MRAIEQIIKDNKRVIFLLFLSFVGLPSVGGFCAEVAGHSGKLAPGVAVYKSLAPIGKRAYVLSEDPTQPSQIVSKGGRLPASQDVLFDPAFIGQTLKSSGPTYVRNRKEPVNLVDEEENLPRPPMLKPLVATASETVQIFGKPLRPSIVPADSTPIIKRANIPLEDRIMERLNHSDKDL